MDRADETVEIHPAAVSTPKGVVLLDTGYPGLDDQIEANLSDAGFGWEDVSGVIITHHDGDHAGALSDVVAKTGATVYAHRNCAPFVDGRKDTVKSPAGERYPPVAVDVELVDGVSFHTDAGPMDVVFTPGHTSGHVSLHFPEAGILVVADALTADESGLAGPSVEFTLEMDEALDSAERLADLEFDTVCCYHGGVVNADGDDIRDIVDQFR